MAKVLKTEVVRVVQRFLSKAVDEDEILRIESHGFSDAISLAYEANIYLRTL